MIYNVLLDFLNRDSRKIYGLYSNLALNDHLWLLNEAINVAVFLCADYCLMPPGFLAEDPLLQQALTRCQNFLIDRMIRMPIKEETLEDFIEKRQREYLPFKHMYPQLFDPDSLRLLKNFSVSLVSRTSDVGLSIVKQWEEGPDISDIWRKTTINLSANEIERIRRIPRSIKDLGLGVTWPSIAERVGSNLGIDPQVFRYILQNHYFRVYINEFNLRIITGLPFTRTNFLLEPHNLCYDYEALKGALSCLGVWKIIQSLSADSMMQLRAQHGYFVFRDFFDKVANKSSSPREVTQVFARGAYKLTSVFKETQFLEMYTPPGAMVIPYGLMLNSNKITAVAERLQAVSLEMSETWEEQQPQYAHLNESIRSEKQKMNQKIAIFVALQMEREILIKRLKLKSRYPDIGFSGELGPTQVIVFGRDEMGRVPAAIETMRFLQKERPDILIVVGIAGGFAKEEVKLGDIVVATRIVDLATRKVLQEDDKNTVPDFRPDVFMTDERITNYLKFKFDRISWEHAVVDEVDWPEGRRPTIRYGTLASLDEVVSSNEWIDRLCKAWPKLLGTEMESGGVCAAAAVFNMKVSVIRGISDLADPAKSDTQWRKRAMETIVHLLKSIEYKMVLEAAEK
jgi:nucleoside phosphorylase